MKTVILVGAAIMSEGKILLLKRTETKRFLPGYYDLPGGKVEEAEDPNLAILREIKEETGLEAKDPVPYNIWHALTEVDGNHEHIIEIDYLVTIQGKAIIKLSPNEHSEYLWANLINLPDKMTSELKSTITKALSLSTNREGRGKQMAQYICTVCEYIYDEEKGDPDGNIKPGTKFEDIPDSWVCPVCGVSKEMFKKGEEKK